MSLVVMSTDPPSSRGSSPYLRPRLSLSTVNTIFSRRNSKSPHPDQRPSTAHSSGLLSPLEPARSRSSSTSRSIRSFTSKSTGKWINRLKRTRSASTNSIIGDDDKKLKKSDFKQLEGWFDAFRKYNMLITNQVSVNPQFSKTELSKIQRIISEIEEGRFIQDLPEPLFDIALLWCPAESLTRNPEGGPSWTWKGWNGGVNFPFDPSSCPDVRKRGEEPVFFKSKINSFVLGPESGPERYTIMNRVSPLKTDPASTQLARITYPREGLQILAAQPPETECDTLRFTTEKIAASNFKMEQIYYDQNEPLLCSGLTDDQGRHCGALMDYEKNISDHQGEGELHYILLSINRRVQSSISTSKSNVSHPSGIPIWREGAFLKNEEIDDLKGFDEGEWNMYNVMLIQEFKEGDTVAGKAVQEPFSRRVAVGRIHKDAWNEAMKANADKYAKIVLR